MYDGRVHDISIKKYTNRRTPAHSKDHAYA